MCFLDLELPHFGTQAVSAGSTLQLEAPQAPSWPGPRLLSLHPCRFDQSFVPFSVWSRSEEQLSRVWGTLEVGSGPLGFLGLPSQCTTDRGGALLSQGPFPSGVLEWGPSQVCLQFPMLPVSLLMATSLQPLSLCVLFYKGTCHWLKAHLPQVISS